MRRLAFLAATAALSFIPTDAFAACTCTCVNGMMRPLCSSTIEIPPPCVGICPTVPPSIQPIPVPTIPPIGAKHCAPEQVWDGRAYRWQTVCR